MAGVKVSKNAQRRAKKKADKVNNVRTHSSQNFMHYCSHSRQATATPASEATLVSDATLVPDSPLDLQPVAEITNDADIDIDMLEEDPLFAQYKDILGNFGVKESEESAATEPDKPQVYYEEDDEIPDEEEDLQKPKMSKKARKQLNKLSIAELKAIVKKPDLVEWTDADASDPRLLVAIKSARNVVPVPSHWALKREYLSSKRGIEKPPFALPKFIQETGIAEMRDAALEKDAEKTLKQKQRERVQPKMGKLDIDYQKLYEAFFRHQTKPTLTRFGEVYYEGKEYETNLKHLRPGELSDELKDALNIPPGAPPPWLINQQRFGPPPSYPALKIPGLNAPLPPGGQWGFHPGGYGKPPTDEKQRPLYGGDIYGIATQQQNIPQGEPVEKELWGELLPPAEEEEEEEEEESDEEEEDEDMGGMETPGGMTTPGGMQSTLPSEFGGMESVAGNFALQKQRRGTETEESTGPRTAWQVIPEQASKISGFFGSDRTYDLKATQAANKNIPMLGSEDNRRKRKVGDVEVSVDVDVLTRDDKLSKEEIAKQYEAGRQETANPWGRVDQEDLSSMIAEESRKRLKKDEERRSKR
jgi:splicing factor 3B subunit 2